MTAKSIDLLTKYKASMLLSGAGDALGYKNEEWEYCTSGKNGSAIVQSTPSV